MKPFPTIEEVDRIAAGQEPVLRNLQITQCYHELSQAMTLRTGACANWCTFATWASKQAGQTIRREDLRRALEQWLHPSTDRAIETVAHEIQQEETEIRERLRLVINPKRIMEHASDAVARGNRKVFAEIGREFARFLASCASDQHYDEAHIAQFCAALRPGDPPNGQRYLQQAFRRYYQAFFETDAKQRAELMLLANIEIGLHEQTRLQPEIAEALNASVATTVSWRPRLLHLLFPYRGWLVHAGWWFLHLIGRPARLDQMTNQLLIATRDQIRLLLTKRLMTLGFPNEQSLYLGKDLQVSFPQSLQQLTNPDLLALLQQVDPTPDSVQETGARDWAHLPDRLHFIVDLFRCYQESADLLTPPFIAEQTLRIKEGLVPEGTL